MSEIRTHGQDRAVSFSVGKLPFLFALIPAVMFLPTTSIAQQTIEGTDKGAQIMMEDWVQSFGANALGDAYGGDSTLNHGYKATPILFDYNVRKYPKLREEQYGQWINDGVPNLQNLAGAGEMPQPDTRSQVQSISTDDEITRSTMAVYQPLRKIKFAIAESEKERDDYLDLFKTLRGVANLTLSYLDKTVAAGLATTESQVNQQSQNQLLKQISWTNSRIANPQRSQIYVDADEKVQACLNTPNVNNGPVMQQGRFADLNPANCTTECGPLPTDETLRYGWCVCCVQQPVHATISSGVEGITGSTPPTKWSLVDRYSRSKSDPNQPRFAGSSQVHHVY